ncbi:MAG: hypothetical protein HYU54_03520 [Actinobacteria bacterium]|nr:hypothetical protein [Actinomycetota bacterium]
MPLRYPAALWARPLLAVWGGARLAAAFHKGFALGFFAAAAMHVGGLVGAWLTGRLPPITGPDSILPGREDVRHLRQNLRYLRGLGPRPEFGRFTYWEKFDYFAEIWGLLVIGLSGLVMWFPEVAARYLPGWMVNAALIFHAYEALLAMGFLFAIHFINTHLRPDVFPIDPVIFSGTIPLEEVRTRYPGWYKRLSAGTDSSIPPAEAPAPGRLAAAVSASFLTVGLVTLVLVMSTAIAEAWGYLVALIR